MSFAMATTVAAIQAKYENKMFFFWEMIEKSLFLKKSPSTILPPDLDTTPKSLLDDNSLPKVLTER